MFEFPEDRPTYLFQVGAASVAPVRFHAITEEGATTTMMPTVLLTGALVETNSDGTAPEGATSEFASVVVPILMENVRPIALGLLQAADRAEHAMENDLTENFDSVEMFHNPPPQPEADEEDTP